MKADQAWQAVLGQLQLDMPKASFDTWVRNTEIVSYEDNVFIVGVPNAYARDWLESRLSSKINRLLCGILNRTVNIRFILWQAGSEQPTTEVTPQVEEAELPSNLYKTSSVINRYTFENFVVGSSNRLAHAASLAVAERPAQAYNPLFLYGGVGLGKTHLLHAIGNHCMNRNLNVLYVTSEEFTNDLINAIRAHTTQTFREKYRRIDVLLIDDIQFIAGKESTQEEFFHTFNSLHGQEKQIVMTSDRPPKALVTLEERLRSRFECGLTADIQPPDFETRVAILRSKSERMGRLIPAEITETIARRVQSNIRELEGSLTRVLALADLGNLPLNAKLVDTALADLLPKRTSIEPDEIVSQVAGAFGVTVQNLIGPDRRQEVVLPRQIAMYLLRVESNCSLPKIGETLGGRDHTTVMYACQKVTDLLERDDKLRRQVIEIRERIYGQSKLSI
ncbi:MAG: chromosomal replication initiation protein DnaA [Chloroflexi bacterium RBG_19FT_COMBO_50_10]|nr:MAG: chromosomal replication initiation protein DnaA [Chloroflexi bacterium RBG_19FT_COMBO_50_10]